MAVLRIIVILYFNILYVASYVEHPIQSWNEPKIWKNKRFSSSTDYLPMTSTEAMTKGWALVQRVGKPYLDLHCPASDGTLCARYDMNGRIVGVMIAIPKNDKRVTTSPYRFNTSPWFNVHKIFLKEYYTLDIFFVSKDHLEDPGRGMPVNSLGETFWIRGKKGEEIEVPVEEKSLALDGWEKQNCEKRKGTHYLHQISDKKNCQDLLPIVMLVKYGEVVGFSFIVPGSFKSPFFRIAGAANFDLRFPNAPDCLKNWASTYKISTLYVTFAPMNNMKKCEASDHVQPPSFKNKAKGAIMDVVQRITG